MLARDIFAIVIIVFGMGVFPVAGKAAYQEHDLMGFEYISPLPGAELVTKDARIIIRPGEELSPASVKRSTWLTVIGSESREHSGDIYFAADRKTVVFNPHESFIPNEMVTVRIREGLLTVSGDLIAPNEFSFKISPKTKPIRTSDEIWYEKFIESDVVYTKKRISSKTKINGISIPTDFPPLEITVNRNPAEGFLFFAPFVFPDPRGAMSYMIVIDNDGQVVYYQRDIHPFGNFRVLWNGNITYYWHGEKTHYIMDSTYSVIDSFNTVGYETDGHEFLYLKNGHVLLVAYDRQIIDMSQIVTGGDPEAIVDGFVIQELDQNRELIFEWRSWDHFKLTDAIDSVDLTAHHIDYAHVNSIDVDRDGNLLISCRNLEECTKISRTTGEIIWRLGGKLCRNNEFTFIGDRLEGFSYQHDFRRVGDNYLVFDNANNYTPSVPRALEYSIDEEAMTVRLVWEYRNRYPVKDSHMGNIQRLSNGNTLIGWGGSYLGTNDIRISEVTPEDEVLFEMNFGKNRYKTYRVYRCDWGGQAKVPYLVAERNHEQGVVILTYNVFGKAEYDKYHIYYDNEPNPTNVVLFEEGNQVEIAGLPNGDHYFRVTALDSSLNETDFSNEVKVTVVWSYEDLRKGITPEQFTLLQNRPNPFSSTTVISYSLPEPANLRISIHDLDGDLIEVLQQGYQEAGNHIAIWNGSEERSGIYFYSIETEQFHDLKKMVLLK